MSANFAVGWVILTQHTASIVRGDLIVGSMTQQSKKWECLVLL